MCSVGNPESAVVQVRRRGRPRGSVSKHRKDVAKAARIARQSSRYREQFTKGGSEMHIEQQQGAKSSASSPTLQRISISPDKEKTHEPKVGVADEEMFRAIHLSNTAVCPSSF
jgi:hypothetical protein